MTGKKRTTVKEVRKDLDKEKRTGNEWTLTKTLLLVLIIIMLALSALFAALAFWPEKEEKAGAVLEVEEVYFVAKEAGGDDIELEIFGFITNDGDAPCDVSIRAFAVDVQTNLAMDQAKVDVGKIEGQKTKEASLSVNLPADGKYRVELLIFKDGKKSVKGEGTVNLANAGTGGRDYNTLMIDEYPEDESKGMAPSIFNVLGIIMAVALCVLIAKRRWKR